MELKPIEFSDRDREWIAIMDKLAKEMADAFQISSQMLGVQYDGQFIPTGPVVESKDNES